jgi:predicted O-methyltransferase YrrM
MISKKIENYTLLHTSDEDPLLHELYRETNLSVVYPRMLSGHLQGKILTLFSYMVNPTFILEIGTYTGYSAICLAKGLKPGGKLTTIEINPELVDFARKYFDRSGLNHSIVQKTGNALDIIPQLTIEWDLVFIDADKENYLNYYKMIIDQMRMGGFIIADNVLWDGKVLNSVDTQDKETRGITEFNDFVQRDSRVENVLLPVRDGLMILRKI